MLTFTYFIIFICAVLLIYFAMLGAMHLVDILQHYFRTSWRTRNDA